jgi:peptidyl-prolyl cis-trans isomerase A (cyclophilin A)
MRAVGVRASFPVIRFILEVGCSPSDRSKKTGKKENSMRVSFVSLVSTAVLALALSGQVGAQGAPDAPVAPPAPAAPAAPPTLKDPATLIENCPDVYKVKFETSQGDFVVEVHRDWAPRAAVRFYNLVKNGYYNDNRFFRVLNGFMAQFGITGDPEINKVWRGARIIDDTRKQTNERGYVSFAAGGPNTRTTQVFINMKDNAALDHLVPFGRVTSGMNTIEKLYDDYGDGPPNGKGPEQAKIQLEGNEYLTKNYPKLDYIKTATLIEDTK